MNGKIIVAPLNWGLGHASRCVPIINALLNNNFTPIIASDGNALTFLKQEFPHLESFNLPSYQISYHKNLKLKLLTQLPHLIKTISLEKKVIHHYLLKNKDVIGIISDNRFGARSFLIPSVYITHQINVFSGKTTFLSSYIHQQIIKKFDECWIPDTINSDFSGKLSSFKKGLNTKYIGVLSRFKKENTTKKIDLLILLSGPEPNRTLLEQKLISEFKNDNRKIVFVLGKIAKKPKKWVSEKITFYNYLLTSELQTLINTSNIVICRSGYSSIMDLAVLHKKVFFIPTKNQSEQEYLALYLEKKGIAPFANINSFLKERISKVKEYKGLKSNPILLDTELFCLFKCK